MQISLNVLTIQGSSPFTSMQYTFDQAGGTVGRAQRADWVLLDDNRFLSGIHFKIYCDEKSFSIVDTSTNGTFLNDSILPLGIDTSHILTEGNQIKIGEYVIIVSSIETLDTQEPNDINIESASTENPQSALDPFFSTEGHFNDSGSSKKGLSTKNSQQKSSFVDKTKESTLLEDPFFSTGDNSFNPDVDLLHDDFDDINIVHPSYPVDINTPISINNPSTRSVIEDQDTFSFLGEEEQPTNTKGVKPETTISSNSHKEFNQATTVSDSASNNNAAINALLKGAGIPQKNVSSQVSIETFEVIGKALNEVIQGTIDLLKSRSEIKNHLHLDRTIISNVENNPLKFMPNAQQVIIQLLISDANDRTYLPLGLALEEAFDDIKAHQIAMTAAAEKALKAVIKQHFSPNSLAENMAKTNPISAVIPVQRQAKLWSMFETLYEDVEIKATESFQRLLDHEISKAYEEQLLEIKSLRNTNRPPK